MNNINTEELQAFLAEAELINQKVKEIAADKADPKEIEEIQRKRDQDKQRREDFKLRQEREALERKIRGREGKGITKDFSHFCRHCHIEYELPTPQCGKCNRPTMTLDQRQEQLKGMVYNYKFNKASREQKRHKWDMFQKTQAALWKKSSINYNQKWDYFVEDSDQEPEQEPILPKNDPNFLALEADLAERKKKREKDNENAKRLKDKGNAAMKEGDHQKAIDMYTLALEHVKDIKSIYTNRALAYLKKKKYQKAIKDCTNVIEYMEVFEKVGENKDLMFKALSRRALARKEAKQYKDALEDVNKALELFPKDNQAALLKKEIENFIKHSETVEKLIRENRQNEVKQESPSTQEKQPENEKQQLSEEERSKQIQKDIVKELAQSEMAQEQKVEEEKKEKIQKDVQKEINPITEIPKRLESLTEENVQYLIQLLIKKNELKSIFVASKGIEKTLQHLAIAESPRNQALLIYMCLQNDGVGEKRVWEFGVPKIYDIILSKFQDESKLNSSIYSFIDNLFQILVPMSLSDIYRPMLSSSQKTYDFLETLFPKLITKYKKQPFLFDNFITFFSNLCSGESDLKNKHLNKTRAKVIIDSLYHFILTQRSKNRQLLDLKQSIYSFIANLITNIEYRKLYTTMLGQEDRMESLRQELELYPRVAHNFDAYIENILSVTANAFLDSQMEAESLAETIFDRFVAHFDQFNQTIVFRAILTVGRIKYTNNKLLPKWMKTFDKMAIKIDPFTNKEDKIIPQAIKILNVLFLIPQPEVIKEIPANLFKLLVKLINKNDIHEALFCNTCNLFGILIERKNELGEKVLVELRKMIGKLVEVAKEKVGNWRKSAAILLGKSSTDVLCREELNKHHGMDVLKSIAQFVVDKK